MHQRWCANAEFLVQATRTLIRDEFCAKRARIGFGCQELPTSSCIPLHSFKFMGTEASELVTRQSTPSAPSTPGQQSRIFGEFALTACDNYNIKQMYYTPRKFLVMGCSSLSDQRCRAICRIQQRQCSSHRFRSSITRRYHHRAVTTTNGDAFCVHDVIGVRCFHVSLPNFRPVASKHGTSTPSKKSSDLDPTSVLARPLSLWRKPRLHDKISPVMPSIRHENSRLWDSYDRDSVAEKILF